MSVRIEWRCDGRQDCTASLLRAVNGTGQDEDENADRRGWTTFYLAGGKQRIDLCMDCSTRLQKYGKLQP